MTINLIQGFALAHNFSFSKKEEDEVKKGGNYYLSACSLLEECVVLREVVEKIVRQASERFSLLPLKAFSDAAPWPTLALVFFTAAVRQGDYNHYAEKVRGVFARLKDLLPQRLADTIDRIDPYIPKIPEGLSPRVARVLHFVPDHMGDLARVAMIVSSFSFLYLGAHPFGGALLGGLVFQELCRYGYVPREIRLFMEMYMPIVCMISCLLGDATQLTRALVILDSIRFFPFSRFVFNQIEQLIKTNTCPALSEYEAPLIERENITKQEILDIFNGSDEDYEMNPAHCSKFAVDDSLFPQNDNFDLLVSLFDSVDWAGEETRIEQKLKNDDVFQRFLEEKFPGESDLSWKEKITQLAGESGKTFDGYLLSETRDRMVYLVEVLTGKRPVEGKEADLKMSLPRMKMIIPYLQNCQDVKKKREVLLILAIEAGNYCAAAILRTSLRIMNEHVIPAKFSESKKETLKATDYFKIALKQDLQNERYRCIEVYYTLLIQAFKSKLLAPQFIFHDIHASEMVFRQYVTPGFYPMDPLQKSRMGPIELLFWELHNSREKEEYMVEEYKKAIVDVARARTDAEVLDYITMTMDLNNLILSDDEKEEILDKLGQSPDVQSWRYHQLVEEQRWAYRRLMLVMMGIWRKKAS